MTSFGVRRCGVQGRRDAPDGYLAQLVAMTVVAVVSGTVTKALVRTLLGRWCRVQMRQHAAATVFENFWSALELWRGARPMPGCMVRELVMACCLCPLYFRHIRKGVSKVTSATDASEKGECIMYSDRLSRSRLRFLKSAEDRWLHPARGDMVFSSPYDRI